MAGSDPAIPTSNGVMPEIVIDDPFAKLASTLERIEAALTRRDPDATQWDLISGAAGQSQHVRFRSDLLVISIDAAAAVTLTIGTRRFVFNIASADTKVIPFITVVDRGIDTIVTVSAGNLGACYLIGNRE